jgi:MFS family permease
VSQAAGAAEASGDLRAARVVLANPRFLALFLSQILTQVGGNMVLYGLTIQVYKITGATTSTSILLLTFLVPAVLFGAVAGVFVDRYDRRLILVWTNVARGLLFLLLIFFDDQLAVIYVVTAIVATLTTFFAPAESAMIPIVVERSQLMTANGLFVFGLQASFALGFAVLGPVAQIVVGTEALILIVAATYVVAGLLCWTLPAAPAGGDRVSAGAINQAELAIEVTFSQLKEGLVYIRDHSNIFWALAYFTITASLIGVLGVLGTAFAKNVLGLSENDLVIIVLPLGAGLVVGILALNLYGKYVNRRRLIEAGLCALAISLLILGLAQRVSFISSESNSAGVIPLLTVVIVVAFVAGISYAFVAVPAQTALQEELPSDVRGRVFGVLNTLVSMASFLPIIIVGPVADVIGTPAVIVICAVVVAATGIASFFFAEAMGSGSAEPADTLQPADPLTVTATTSSNLSRPIRIRYVDDAATDEATRIVYAASPVVPGQAGPAGVAPVAPTASASTPGVAPREGPPEG